MTYIMQFLAHGKQPQWSGIFRTREEAYEYVDANEKILDEQGCQVIILYKQDKKYRLFFEDAAFMEEECDEDEEGEKEKYRQEGFCPHCKEFKSNQSQSCYF